MPEGQILKRGRLRARLRINELQFVAAPLLKLRACLRAHADPIQPNRNLDGPVRLDRNLEAARMQRVDQLLVELQQRLASGTNYKSPARICAAGPFLLDRRRQRFGRLKLSPVRSVRIGKFSVAKLADRRRAVLFVP